MTDLFQLFKSVVEYFTDYTNKVSTAGQKWGEYGWVPYLPQSGIVDILSSVYAPSTQKEADDLMINKADECFEELLKEIKQYVVKYGANQTTFNEAVETYNIKLYTSCCLNLFALIDHIFITKQEKLENQYRMLAKGAIDKKLQTSKTANYFVIATSIKYIIDEVFKNGDDFKPENEGNGNRNYISHGVNTIIPDRIFCLKLFVLLYNIYLLYSTKIFDEGDNV